MVLKIWTYNIVSIRSDLFFINLNMISVLHIPLKYYASNLVPRWTQKQNLVSRTWKSKCITLPKKGSSTQDNINEWTHIKHLNNCLHSFIFLHFCIYSFSLSLTQVFWMENAFYILSSPQSISIHIMHLYGVSRVVLVVKNLPARLNPRVRKIPWRRAWQPTPVFSARESHGHRCLAGYNPKGLKELDRAEAT